MIIITRIIIEGDKRPEEHRKVSKAPKDQKDAEKQAPGGQKYAEWPGGPYQPRGLLGTGQRGGRRVGDWALNRRTQCRKARSVRGDEDGAEQLEQ